MSTYPVRRTIITESAITLSSHESTLYDLRAFVEDTEGMDDTSRVQFRTSPEFIGGTISLRVVQEEQE